LTWSRMLFILCAPCRWPFNFSFTSSMSFATVIPEYAAQLSPSSSLSLSFSLRCLYVRWPISIAVKGFRRVKGAAGGIAFGIAEDSVGGETIGTCSAAIAGKDTGTVVADVAHGTADTNRCTSLEAGVSAGADSVATNDTLLCAAVSECTLGVGDDDREARPDILGIRRCSRTLRKNSGIASNNPGSSFDLVASVICFGVLRSRSMQHPTSGKYRAGYRLVSLIVQGT
jgi:hypothetical protein